MRIFQQIFADVSQIFVDFADAYKYMVKITGYKSRFRLVIIMTTLFKILI